MTSLFSQMLNWLIETMRNLGILATSPLGNKVINFIHAGKGLNKVRYPEYKSFSHNMKTFFSLY